MAKVTFIIRDLKDQNQISLEVKSSPTQEAGDPITLAQAMAPALYDHALELMGQNGEGNNNN